MLWNAAKALVIVVQPYGERETADFVQAIESMTSDTPDGILMVSDPLTDLNRKVIFQFALAHRLPGIYENDFIARDGGLMSYGLDLDDSFERFGALIDRILKGALPSELPFEESTRFRLTLNLKTAKSNLRHR